jgi:predicted GNAT superfamily acetyltransferase
MTYVMPRIAPATPDDIAGMLALQELNQLDQGGLLSVRFSRAWLEASLKEMPSIVARRDGQVVAYLLSASITGHADVPIIQAMFRAYPGSPGAYLYGPVCVAESERGHGLATILFEALRARLPGRECVTFIRRDNAASLRAHAKMGMKEVAEFTHGNAAHVVVAHPG